MSYFYSADEETDAGRPEIVSQNQTAARRWWWDVDQARLF